MKKYNSVIQILSFACVCLIGAGSAIQSADASAPENSGHLLIYRGAKFGYRLNLLLSVDGKDLASLTEGQTYDGYLPAGQHELVARVTPRSANVNPARHTLTIEPGHTYSYTAVLSGKNLVLVKKK